MGRGNSGKEYGTEYRTVLKRGNIKFVKAVEGAQTPPMITKTSGRVYVTINKNDNIKAITYFDKQNKRVKQIDMDVAHEGVLPHTHHGYLHNENDSKKGYAHLTPEEKEMVERVREIWYNRNSK